MDHAWCHPPVRSDNSSYAHFDGGAIWGSVSRPVRLRHVDHRGQESNHQPSDWWATALLSWATTILKSWTYFTARSVCCERADILQEWGWEARPCSWSEGETLWKTFLDMHKYVRSWLNNNNLLLLCTVGILAVIHLRVFIVFCRIKGRNQSVLCL